MLGRLWRSLLRRLFRGSVPRKDKRSSWGCRRPHGLPPALLTFVVAAAVAWSLISMLEIRLRPFLRDTAQYQIKNKVVSLLEHEITREMTSYSSFIRVQRDDDGRITSLTTDTASLNLLRADLVSGVMDALSEMDRIEISVPLGSLVDSELIWGKGPEVNVRSIVLGTIMAEFQSSLSSAGVNQTLHRLWLEIELPVRLFLPGGPVDLSIETSLTVAETVIVGEIPNYIVDPARRI